MHALTFIACLSGVFAAVHMLMVMIDVSFGHTDDVLHKLIVSLASGANSIAIFIIVHSLGAA